MLIHSEGNSNIVQGSYFDIVPGFIKDGVRFNVRLPFSSSIEVIFWIPSALTLSTFVINFSRDIFVLPPLKIWIAYLYFTAGGFFLFSRNPEPQFV